MVDASFSTMQVAIFVKHEVEKRSLEKAEMNRERNSSIKAVMIQMIKVEDEISQ